MQLKLNFKSSDQDYQSITSSPIPPPKGSIGTRTLIWKTNEWIPLSKMGIIHSYFRIWPTKQILTYCCDIIANTWSGIWGLFPKCIFQLRAANGRGLENENWLHQLRLTHPLPHPRSHLPTSPQTDRFGKRRERSESHLPRSKRSKKYKEPHFSHEQISFKPTV